MSAITATTSRVPAIVGAAMLLTLLTGCPEDPPEVEPDPAPAAEPAAEPEAEPENDAGSPGADAGPVLDGGLPTNDGGTPTDGGLPGVDGGPTPDGGGPGLDGGLPGVDAGVDAGPPVIDAGPPMNACVVESDGPGFQISSKARLRWKRVRVVERDLMNAFLLTPELVCAELGAAICYTAIHRVPLGGHEPVVSSMYKGIDAPGATTSISFDRVVLSACGARVDLDTLEHTAAPPGEFGASILFRHYRLDAPFVSSQSPEVRAQVTDIYRRVLAREPTNDEVRRVALLAEPVDGVLPTARDFSKMACYAITSTSEFLFQ